MWQQVLNQLLHRMLWLGVLVLALPLIVGLIARLPIFFSPDPDDSSRETADRRVALRPPDPEARDFALPSDEPPN
jgi:hypothetical protein